jgi:hypothetical protein
VTRDPYQVPRLLVFALMVLVVLAICLVAVVAVIERIRG